MQVCLAYKLWGHWLGFFHFCQRKKMLTQKEHQRVFLPWHVHVKQNAAVVKHRSIWQVQGYYKLVFLLPSQNYCVLHSQSQGIQGKGKQIGQLFYVKQPQKGIAHCTHFLLETFKIHEEHTTRMSGKKACELTSCLFCWAVLLVAWEQKSNISKPKISWKLSGIYRENVKFYMFTK